MDLFLVTLALSILLLVVTALVINYCKKRTRNSRHELTGMCHEQGGAMCTGCSSTARPSTQSEPDNHHGRNTP